MRSLNTRFKVKQDTVLWITVLEHLAWMLEDRFGLIPNEPQRFYLDQIIGLRLALQRRAIGRKSGLGETQVFLRHNPFDHVRRLARSLAQQAHKRVPNERQLNSRFVEYGFYPVRTSTAVGPIADVLLGRLVLLADHLAGQTVDNPYARLDDLDHDRPISFPSARYVSLLFWDGLMEGVRVELDAWYNINQAEERAAKEAFLVDLQLKIHEHRVQWRRTGDADEPVHCAFLPVVNSMFN